MIEILDKRERKEQKYDNSSWTVSLEKTATTSTNPTRGELSISSL